MGAVEALGVSNLRLQAEHVQSRQSGVPLARGVKQDKLVPAEAMHVCGST
jgi:hypothetical protein